MSVRLDSVWRTVVHCAAASVVVLILGGCHDDPKRPQPSVPTPTPTPTPTPPPTYTIGGTVAGLLGTLTLVNNGGDARTIDASGSFTFATSVAANAAYAVTVQSQPSNQSCTVTNGAGTATANVTNVVVACETVRVTATVGAAGGSVLGPDGVQVDFPAGALTQDTVIGIARSSQGAPPPPSNELRAANIYEFTPHDIVFNESVTIRMPVPAGTTADQIMMASPGTDWRTVEAQIASGTAIIPRGTFSWSGVYPCAFNPNDPTEAPDGCVRTGITAALTSVPANALTLVGSTPLRRYQLTQSGTVRFRLNYQVPGLCINASARIRRGPVQANGALAQPLETFVEQGAPLTLNNLPTPGLAADGVVTIDVPMDHTMNGRWFYSAQVSCTRNGQLRTFADGVYVENTATAPTVTYSIGGSVNGLTGSGLVLQNNAADDLTITTDGPFAFPHELPAGSSYSVSVLTQPSSPAQTCSVQNGTGTANTHVTNVAVTCASQGAKFWRPAQLIEQDASEAYAPQVGFDAAGNAIAIWRQKVVDPASSQPVVQLMANRYTRAGGWGSPTRIVQITQGDFHVPELGVAANGSAVAVWNTWGAPVNDVASSIYTPGVGWSTPAPIETNARHSSAFAAAFNAGGSGIAVWTQEVDAPTYGNVWASRYTPGAGWGTPALIEDSDNHASASKVAVNASGDAMVLLSQEENGALYRSNRYVAGSWGTAVPITATVGLSYEDVALGLDDAGNAVLALTYNDDVTRVHAVRYTNGSWGSLDTIHSGGSPFGLKLAMRGSGEALILWSDYSSSSIEIWARPYGTWTGSAGAAFVAAVNNMLTSARFDPDGSVLTVWTDRNGGRVRAARYTHGASPAWSAPVDIATNLPDAWDIALAIDDLGNAMAVWSQHPGAGAADIGASVYR